MRRDVKQMEMEQGNLVYISHVQTTKPRNREGAVSPVQKLKYFKRRCKISSLQCLSKPGTQRLENKWELRKIVLAPKIQRFRISCAVTNDENIINNLIEDVCLSLWPRNRLTPQNWHCHHLHQPAAGAIFLR